MIDSLTLPVPGAVLDRATEADVAELLVLQRCCWVSEAIANGTFDVPALHEDLRDVASWVDSHAVWTVRVRGRLIAAVRAHHHHDDRWQIGRLMVAPDLAGRGIGRWLLGHAERQAPAGVRHLDLFTGGNSERNLRMYTRAGYRGDAPPPDHHGAHIHGAVFLTKTRSETTVLFAYGTLQQPSVQRATFGRDLVGRPDRLPGFASSVVEITDPDVVARNGMDRHPGVRPSGGLADEVVGTAFDVTWDELAAADSYEIALYHRAWVPLSSGTHARVYVIGS